MAKKARKYTDNQKLIITILLLVLFFPVGALVMWFWTGWRLWIKIVISYLGVCVIFFFLYMNALLSYFTSDFFYQKIKDVESPSSLSPNYKDFKRRADMKTILDALNRYKADHGVYPDEINSPFEAISTQGADLCKILIPEYLDFLPTDPSIGDSKITDCEIEYRTGYVVLENNEGKVWINAPLSDGGNWTYE